MENVWLIQGPVNGMSTRGLKLRINTRVFSFEQKFHSITIQEIYRVSDHYPLTIRPVGIWNKKLGLTMTKSSFWQRRSNLQGLAFTCITIEVDNIMPLIVISRLLTVSVNYMII